MNQRKVIEQLKEALTHMCYSTYATAKYNAKIVQDALDTADYVLATEPVQKFVEGIHIVHGERWLVQRLMAADEFKSDKGA